MTMTQGQRIADLESSMSSISNKIEDIQFLIELSMFNLTTKIDAIQASASDSQKLNDSRLSSLESSIYSLNSSIQNQSQALERFLQSQIQYTRNKNQDPGDPPPTANLTTASPISEHPPTNLNIEMDNWGGHGNVSTAVPGVEIDGSQSQPCLQVYDERDLKRQKRKQSNRESGYRSRLRKQAERHELAERAEVLNRENLSLRADINKLKSQYEELLAQNSFLKTLERVNLDKNMRPAHIRMLQRPLMIPTTR